MNLPPGPSRPNPDPHNPAATPPIPVIGGAPEPLSAVLRPSTPPPVPATAPSAAAPERDDDEAEGAFLVLAPGEAAALAAAEGHALFPLVPGAKRPAVGLRWQRASSSDPDMVERVFGAFSARVGGGKLAGVGVDCGKSDLVVVDVDGPISDELQAALDEVPTLVWASAVRGAPHYVFRQRVPAGHPGRVGCPKLAGADVKGDGGLVARSARPPIVAAPVAVLPNRLAELLVKAGGAGPGGGDGSGAYVSPSDLHDWLAGHPGQVDDATAEGFAGRKVEEFWRKVEAGDHRREAARDTSLGMTIEVAAGCYSGVEAFDRLREAYRAARTDDPQGRNTGPEKGWTVERQRDHELMWRGALSRVLGGWYDDAIAETAERAGVVPEDEWSDLTDLWDRLAGPVPAPPPPPTGAPATPTRDRETGDTAPSPTPAEVEPKSKKAKETDAEKQKRKRERARKRARHATPSMLVGHNYPDGTPAMGPDARYGPLATFCESVAAVSEASYEPLFVTALAHWGVFCGGGWRIEAGGGTHPPDIWVCVVAPSATVKGRSLRAVRPAFDYRTHGPVVPGETAPLAEGLPASGEAMIQVFQPRAAGPGLPWGTSPATAAAVEALDRAIDKTAAEVAAAADPDRDPDLDLDPVPSLPPDVWPDPRVLFVETEFGSALSRWKRGGSVMPHLLRQASDRTTLSNRTVARGREYVEPAAYHAAVLGHVTPFELRALLSDTETFGGTTGRFLWAAANRQRAFPEGEGKAVMAAASARLAAALWPTGLAPGHGPGGRVPHGQGPARYGGLGLGPGFVSGDGVRRIVGFDRDAAELWRTVYTRLVRVIDMETAKLERWSRAGRSGRTPRGQVVETIVARATGHIPRLALALWLSTRPDLADGALWWGDDEADGWDRVLPVVPPEALAAAVAVWDFCEASVDHLFGVRSGDPTFDRVLAVIREAGTRGVTGRELHDVSYRYGEYVARGIDLGLLVERVIRSGSGKGGRPTRRIFAVEYAPPEGPEGVGGEPV